MVESGSAAFSVAIEARRGDVSVVMIENATLGGTCVNTGFIPSKALLAAAQSRHSSLQHRFPGIGTSADEVDMAAFVGGKNEIVAELRRTKYEELVALHGFEVRRGHARFVPGPAIEVDGQLIRANRFVIATGASPWMPPIPGLASTGYLTSSTAMDLDELPESLVVIGGGAVGLEQAQLFSRLGCQVTLIEALHAVAPHEEPEISKALAAILQGEGITIHAGAKITSVSRDEPLGEACAEAQTMAQKNKPVIVSVEVPGAVFDIRASAVLVAVGRRPNTRELGLDEVGVKLGQFGQVIVDSELRTTNALIYAAGDVTGHPQFVHVAGKHGSIVAQNSAQNGAQNGVQNSVSQDAKEAAHARVDYRTLPRVIFSSPAIASVGLTEHEAKALSFHTESRVLPFSQLPAAIIKRDTRGLAKVVVDRVSRRVLGVHLLGEGAPDAIAAAVYALEADFSVDQLADIWVPYLTTAEAIKLAAHSFSRDVASLSCCA